jgi:hypothetical protein
MKPVRLRKESAPTTVEIVEPPCRRFRGWAEGNTH